MYLYIVEEHHEAFIVWHHALQKGFISKSHNNHLVHLDEHSDMSSPRLNTPLHQVPSVDIADFTYQELNIASFIVPSLYLGFFNTMHWVRQNHQGRTAEKNELYVRTKENSGKWFVTGKYSLIDQCTAGMEGTDIVRYDYYKQQLQTLPELSKVFLDIDLDYFSCNVNPLLNGLSIEVTEDEYHSFRENRYHRLNYFDFGKVEAIRREGKFYFLLNHFNEKYESPLKVSDEQIETRVSEAISVLDQRISPSIISLCRSRHSGYTPLDQWEEIENQVIAGLQQIYAIEDVIHISEITMESTLAGNSL